MSAPWLTIVGIGDNGADSLSAEGRAALEAADTVLAPRRILDGLDLGAAEILDWSDGFRTTLETILSRRGRPLVILATGDPMHFGIGATLSRFIDPEDMRIIPAPSAFSLAAARLGWALQDAECISLHGRAVEKLLAHLADGRRLIALTSDGETVRAAANLLVEAGYGRSRLSVLEHMGGEREARLSFHANDLPTQAFGDFNTLAIDCVRDAGAALDGNAPGLPDDAFEHDGQMTKQEVRAAVLAHLRPAAGRRLIDIGAGCGSISIEWLRASPGGSALAIEPVDARLRMIRVNADRLGTPELETLNGRAPAALQEIAPADAVFIGGGLSAERVFATAFEALKPGGRLAATAVTLESEARMIALYQAHGGMLSRISVSRAEPVGRFSGWKPAMPVTLWAMEKPR